MRLRHRACFESARVPSGPHAYVVVGRARDCDVVLDDASVSARHARLSWDGERILIDDLGSANGTFVDGRAVHHECIRPGDDVTLGQISLPWSDDRVREFLRAGPRRTTLRSDRPRARGRGFVCGACHVRGVLPPGFTEGELVCAACGAHLVLGEDGSLRRRAIAAAAIAVAAILAGALTASALSSVAPARPESAWTRLGRAMGISSGAVTPAAASAEEASIRARVAPRVATAIAPDDAAARNLAVRIAADADGPFHVEQVARIWAHVRRSFHYVSDPRGGEYFARATETISNGMAGDCDDFAILMITMVQAIGGRGRMVMVDGDDGGHAYAEVCIDAPPAEVAQRLAGFYRSDAVSEPTQVGEVHYRSDATCPVWLNLDWNARVPGGAYGRERWAVAIHPDATTETLVAARLGRDAPPVTPRLVPLDPEE